ncbi:competence type IV pilus ATPase ComGA [Solibacillus sp. FSL K6-1523]|uniref:competence type IV pilus ATPase ComGA n=1 Tax=Solibacillus sp. FSL K6-1523 TaxID=2921471 RepID=UPI0040469167
MMEQESIIKHKCEQLLLRASHFDASDLHLLPGEHQYKIMFRKYGQFIHAGELQSDIAKRMISYFKFLSSLDISEKRKPQSGAFQKQLNDHFYSFRISTLPSAFQKESLAIRLLRQNYTLPISTLCYDTKTATELCELITQSQGLLLISGATGSGKTTSLYSLVQYCSNELSRHVISLEDPVESSQEQLLQIQVNERAGVTYAAGLKAILRHSPDVIMVGEIRDKETAKIAIQAAFTGHLVISTIHAKDTINCLYRLMDLEVSVEEMRQMLIAVVSQTLISTEQDEQKALFEILSEATLETALNEIAQHRKYTLPYEQTLAGQRAKLGVKLYEPTSS